MKPMFSALNTWSCIILSLFAIAILTPIAFLFRAGHESFVGSVHDPEDGKTVASTLLGAVAVYACFLVFCSGQAWLHRRGRVELQ